MSRLHVTHMLTDFMDETLAWQPTEKVKAHLAFCNVCRQALNDLKKGIALLGATPEAVPSSDLERRIVDWMSVERSAPVQERRLPSWVLRLRENKRSAALAFVLIAGSLGLRQLIHRHAAEARRHPAAVAPAPRAPETKRSEARGAKETRTGKSAAKPAALSAAAMKAAEAKARADVQPAPMEGAQSAVREEMTKLVDSELGWRELWLRHHANADRVPKLPEVDFSQNQVIAIFAGQKPTAGYRVQVISLSETPWNGEPARLVKYRIQGPAKGAIAAQVVTDPFLFRVVPRFSGPTFFEKNP